MLGHLLKSLIILLNVSDSISQMQAQRFCSTSINILIQHRCKGVIELKPLDVRLVEDIRAGVETAISLVIEDMNQDTLLSIVESVALGPCKELMSRLDYEVEIGSIAPAAVLLFLRKSILLLDMSIVSYVRSHGSGFGISETRKEVTRVEVSDVDDSFAFRASFTRLACLDTFLDKREVWVFSIYNHKTEKKHVASESAPQPSSVLTSMRELADVWGPVYSVPTASGLIKHYVVSKGVICRVSTKRPCLVPGAVQCHYFSRLSFFRRNASRLLSKEPDLLLAESDTLLIGTGLKENQYCKYTMSQLCEDFAPDFTVLGTRESVWQTETRSATVGISKIFGILVSGTQKLIPQTTLKQHILDKWTANPSRANPGILNQFLGVEMSHCTGNARRVSMGALMVSDSMKPILDRQIPDWDLTSWGCKLSNALWGDNRDDIFQIWKDYASKRTKIAELVCSLLEVLDNTGLDERGKFHAAVLYDNEEYALPIATNLNDWSIALQDTHITAAYVLTNEICLNCEVPNHSTSSCHLKKAYTVLQTHFAIERADSPLGDYDLYKLLPDGKRFRKVDGGSQHVFLLTPASLYDRAKKSLDCMELRVRPRRSGTGAVYLRASHRSHHGKEKQKVRGRVEPRIDLETWVQGIEAPAQQDHRNQADPTYPDTRNEGLHPDLPIRGRTGETNRHQPFHPPRHPDAWQVFAPPPPFHVAESSQGHGLQALQDFRWDAQPQSSTFAPPLLSPQWAVPHVEDLITSDVYGHNIYANMPDRASILDDVANYDLHDDDERHERRRRR